MADRRGLVVPLVILAWIFLGPDPARQSQARFEQRPSYDDVIAQEERSLSVLQNSSYGDLNSPYGNVLNLTGLEDERGYAWNALPMVQERARERLQYALGDAGTRVLSGGADTAGLPALYSNVTGYAHGQWTRSKLEESIHVPQLNLSSYAPAGPFGPLEPRPFGRNVTGPGGSVRLRFHERTPFDTDPVTGVANITGISVEMALQDAESGDEHELQLYGIYNLQLGQVILTTTSDKLAGIYTLPHFALSQHTFEAAK
ncbi:hypothetical protein LTR53_011815, partial [Teratosphaeriaceae sp. CCFEE 6253]